ncbi:MAG: tetratricopeptide repeat protein [Bacteroidia bacterium]
MSVKFRVTLLSFALLSVFNLYAHHANELDSLKGVLQSKISDSARVVTLQNIAYNYEDAGDDSLSNIYFRQALKISEDHQLRWGVAKMLIELSHNLRLKGDFEEMKKYLNRAEQICIEIKDIDDLGQIKFAWGGYYKDISDYQQAITFILESVKLFEQVHDQNRVIFAYHDLANLYRKMDQPQKALDYYTKVYVKDSTVNDSINIASDITNIGLVYSDMKAFPQSISYLQKAISIKKRLGNLQSLATTLNILASVYIDLKDYKQALELLFQALELKKQFNDLKGIAISCVNIGDVYTAQKKYDDAIKYYNESVVAATQIKNIDIIKEDYKGLAAAYAGKNDMGKAYDFHLKYTALKDSIYNESNSRQIADMQTKYETDKKDQENQLLQAKNEVSETTIHQQKVVSYFISGGLILALSLAFFIFRGYKQKQKANEIITKQKEEVEKQKQIVDEKNLIVEEKNKEILDSIHYAKRIQRALLTSDNYLKKTLPEHFILYKPKDIVSGDFYWSVKQNNKVYIATADCTGHGVPGAFMSLVGISFLNEILIEKKITSPEIILNQLREEIIKALNQEDADEESKDGMDIVLCCYDFETMQLTFAAANNSLYMVRNKELIEFKPDKFPVGKYDDQLVPFTLQTVPLRKGDCIYSFTDGYADQFGGPSGKKYKYKQFQQLLLNNSDQPLGSQKQKLDQEMESWKGSLEQVDDILIIGIRV